MARETELQVINERVGRVPRVLDGHSLVLAWGYLLPSETVVLHVVDDLQTALQKEAKQNSKAEHLETPDIVHHSQVHHFSQLHQEDLVE